jgi:hypothetical protein
MFGVSYTSSGPTIRGGGWKGSGQDVNVPLLHYGLVSQMPHCPLLLAQTTTIGFTRKEDNQQWFTVYTKERGNSVPIRTKVSPTNNNTYI